MKQLAVAAVSALAVAGAAAGLASAADGFSLALVGPLDPAVAGQPAIVEIAGVNSPPSEYHFMTWLQVDVFVPSVVPECPAGTGEANQLAAGTGGAILTIAARGGQREGRLVDPARVHAARPGPLLLCGYSYDDVGAALARASLMVDVGAARPAAPASVAAPTVRRAGGRLNCRPGTWSNSPSRFSYRWWVASSRRPAGRTAKLRVTRALRGRTVRCSVTASNPGGSATATSRRMRVR
jgi:hypothetical protein